ncbi:10 kDa heat shock protein, mitochondrial-like [Diorhabda carinulata]|uniref:10 kDa heat shock protein, mitochondrial-like n=1 Tax=Diorhabda sublineata TaxID=1163346 RepID=UPI0024E07BF6|nr:10 kDa heat shock protein, mitochondrial-like [Diorhabda sublineata]XP_057664907.1 10 kDa heat shock protein, mitochondrial-like [Diorhabda carinulata]
MSAAPKIATAVKIKKIVPLMNRVLIKKAEPETQTKGGIVLPDKTKVKLQRGTVLAVGPGNKTENGQIVPVNVCPGDEVILADYGGTKIELDKDEVYFLYRENEILAKLKE